MDKKVSLGVLFACAGLTACFETGSEAPSIIVPIAGVLDAAAPFGVTTGVVVPMLSADLDGVSSIEAEIIFNADLTFTINLPSGGSITVADTDIVGAPAFDADLNTTTATYIAGADDQVDVHLGEDSLGGDLFVLARYEDLAGPVPSTLAFMVVGDETATLPTGTATFTGGFLSNVFDATGAPVAELSGTSVIATDFDADTVDVTLTAVGEDLVVFTGTSTAIVGAQYAGTMTSSGAGTDYSGAFNGAFFGPNAEATAGTFNAEDTTAATEIVGGFTGFQ